MKKTRILAALLSLMMVVCALPMMQASAALTQPVLASTNLGAAIADVMNEVNGNEAFNTAYPFESNVTWAPCNLDFTDPDMANDPYMTVLDSSVTFGENGATFGETEGKMRYFPGEANLNADAKYWSPTGETGYYAFSFKLGEAGNLASWTNVPSNYTVARVEVTPEGVVVYSGNGPGAGLNDESLVTYYDTENKYAPGTGWNDVLIKMSDTYNPYQVWMKKTEDTSFTKIAEAKYPANVAPVTAEGTPNYGYNIGFGLDCTNSSKGITFIGTNANVGYAASYKGYATYTYNSVDEILGMTTGSTYAFDFDENTNLANSAGRVGFTAEGYQAVEDGLTLVDPADETTKFTFAPFGNYSPLNGTTNWASDTYVPQALYLKAKGGFNLLTPGPNAYGRIDMNVTVGREVEIASKTKTYSFPVTIENEWTEYLVVPNNLTPNTHVAADGYSLYIKGEAATGGVWYKAKDYGFENPTSNYSSYGLSFYKVTGNIKSVRMLSIGSSVADSATVPANGTIAYLNEEFDAMPNYPSMSTQGEIGEVGTMVFPTTNSSMDFKLSGVEIPVGGYAEFRVQHDGIASYRFYDGEKVVTITQQSDYGVITDGVGYCGSSNTTWRTWRFVRSEEGYNVYSKADGDTGWVSHATNAGDTSDKDALIHLNFGTRNGSDPEGTIITGESKLDYIKVYGPAADALTLIDGYTTRVLADGDTMIYPEAIRVQVAAEEGNLLMASYNGKVIVDVQVIDVATEMTDGATTLDLTQTSGSSVRFFLWDGYDKIEALADDITLTF